MAQQSASAERCILAPEIQRVSEVYFMSLDCPRSLTAFILLQAREYDQLAKLKAKPVDYASPEDYHLAACASDWLRKFPGLPVRVDREAEAKKSWYQSEMECKRQNASALLGFPAEVCLLIDIAAEFCARVLGPCPLDLTPSFGPGATASDPVSRTTVLDKVSSKPTMTSDMTALLPLWQGTAWERSLCQLDGYKKSNYSPRTVKGNTFFTVPKTALIDRACAKGPSINISYQLAVGKQIRRRMKSYLGLDLATGQTRHNALAKRGSATGEFATIDSERASDTNSFSTVSLILSKSGFWLDLMKVLREPFTLIDDKWVALEKFSAMGNGFTFELETLVFLSLCYSVAWAHEIGGFPAAYAGMTSEDLVRSGAITVYGDDVIVPSFIAKDVTAVLRLLGFTVNLQKSYLEGEFRESCGGDYFSGVDVNTPKLTEEVTNPANWFAVHNKVKSRFVDKYPFKNGKMVLQEIKNQLPRSYRSMYGPRFLGDRVLHGWYGPQVTAHGRLVRDPEGRSTPDPNQWVGRLKVLSPKVQCASFKHYDPDAQLAYFLYTCSSEPPMRRPVGTVEWKVSHWEGDYHIIFSDYVPRAPAWLSKSPYARFFGIAEDGSYVG